MAPDFDRIKQQKPNIKSSKVALPALVSSENTDCIKLLLTPKLFC